MSKTWEERDESGDEDEEKFLHEEPWYNQYRFFSDSGKLGDWYELNFSDKRGRNTPFPDYIASRLTDISVDGEDIEVWEISTENNDAEVWIDSDYVRRDEVAYKLQNAYEKAIK